MTTEPIWLTVEDIEEANKIAVAATGETFFVRDPGLLASALDRPKNLLNYGDPEPDLLDLAVCLLFAIARNHPFEQGNKRAATHAFLTFLRVNGLNLDMSGAAESASLLGYLILSALEGHITEEHFTYLIEPHVHALPEDIAIGLPIADSELRVPGDPVHLAGKFCFCGKPAALHDEFFNVIVCEEHRRIGLDEYRRIMSER